MPKEESKYKTRIPVPRVKQIMQSDNQVGKIAQVTPHLISRVVEAFIEDIVYKAKEQNAGQRMLQAGYLKAVVEQDPTFDFLRETVSHFQDAPAGKADDAQEKPKGKRAKKAAADDDDDFDEEE